MEKASLDEIIKRRSILIPSNEIYGTFAGFYDYGPIGKRIKQNIENFWREFFIKKEGLYEVETANIVPEIVLKNSGHVDNFNDPMAECVNCKRRFKGDEYKEKCPDCGGTLTEAKQFNLMFKTNIGSLEGNTGYARPETAQGIFLDFQRIFNSYGQKLPMGIAQIGRSFRNEISPRKGLIRLREFTQMEIEFFFDPENPTYENFEEVSGQKIRIYTREEQAKESNKITEMTAKEGVEKLLPNQIMGHFLAREALFFQKLGIPPEKLRFRHMTPEETPHYSGGNFDCEIETGYGWVECVGNAYRTNYDLKKHSEGSGKTQEVTFNEKKVLPHVVEPSFGVDRTFWCVLEHAYRNQGKDWGYLSIPPMLSPYEVALFPLMKKDELVSKAKKILLDLREQFFVLYDASGSIGKRYARADEIGIPYCITVDYETLEKNKVTIRFREDGGQESSDVKKLVQKIQKYYAEGKLLKGAEKEKKKKK